MLQLKWMELPKLDEGAVATAVLGVLVAGMSAAILVLIYMPVR